MAKIQENIMRYDWPHGGLIERIEIHHQPSGRAVAYVQANNDPALHDQRLEVRAALRLKGWGTLSDHRNGAFVLRVNGFGSDAELLETLNTSGYVQGTPSVLTQSPPPPPAQGLWDSIRSNSLGLSGKLYSFGNAIYIASGIHRGKVAGKVDVGQIGAGLAFGAGDALLAVVGDKDDGRQFTSLLTQLKHHYEREGIDIPITAAIHSETSDKGKTWADKAYDFLHRNVNVIKCGAEVVGGVFYYNAGKEQNNIWKQRTALIFGTGFLASALIPEKKLDEEKYAHANLLQKGWILAQSNPLTIGAVSGYSNTILTTVGAFKERAAQQALGAAGNTLYRWDFAIPATMLFANSLYAISKKTTGGDIQTDAMVRDVYSVAAQIINKQPEEKREAALESTARFLGERPEITDRHAQIVERLRKEIAVQQQNPWFEPRIMKTGVAAANDPMIHPPVAANDPIFHTGGGTVAPIAMVAGTKEHLGTTAPDAVRAVG